MKSIPRILTILLILTLAIGATACKATPTPTTQPPAAEKTPVSSSPTPTPGSTPTSAPVKPKILHVVQTGYSSMTGYTIEDPDNGRKIQSDELPGTGDTQINLYLINSDGTNRTLLTSHLSAWGGPLFLVGDMLYFYYYYEDDDGTFYDKLCRLDIVSGGEPEFLEISFSYITDHYFYYYKDQNRDTLYRSDSDWTTEISMPNLDFGDWYIWSGSDKLFAIEGSYNKPEQIVRIFNEDGTLLDSIDVVSPHFARGYDYDHIYYWCEAFGVYDAPSTEGVIHRYDLQTRTHLPDMPFTLDRAIDGAVIQKIEDGIIHFNVFADATPEVPTNLLRYTVPVTGGTPELVAAWFES